MAFNFGEDPPGALEGQGLCPGGRRARPAAGRRWARILASRLLVRMTLSIRGARPGLHFRVCKQGL